MSTKVLSKSYIRSYIHAHYQEGLVELLQQASFDSWLDYPTILQLEIVLRTRVHYSPLQYTTEDPSPSSYGRAILGTHTYLEAFSSFHLLVYELYRQPSSPLPRTRLFEYMILTLRGCTSSHTHPPLIAVYTTCTRQPSRGSPTRVSATAYLNTQVSSPGLSPIQVPSAGSPAEVSTNGPE